MDKLLRDIVSRSFDYYLVDKNKVELEKLKLELEKLGLSDVRGILLEKIELVLKSK